MNSNALAGPHPARNLSTPASTATVRLAESSHHFLRTVTCRDDDGTILIEGKVPSFFLKQTAQTLVQSVDGVRQVVNRLEVVNPYGISGEPNAE